MSSPVMESWSVEQKKDYLEFLETSLERLESLAMHPDTRPNEARSCLKDAMLLRVELFDLQNSIDEVNAQEKKFIELKIRVESQEYELKQFRTKYGMMIDPWEGMEEFGHE